MKNKEFREFVFLGAGLVLLLAALCGLLFGVAAFFVFLVFAAALFAAFLLYTKKRYRELEELNGYLSRVLAGDYDIVIAENEEGELSILRSNIYKATVLLREKNELLSEEKEYLTDMLANISHQLKTPLTSIMMMNELLSGESSQEKRKEFVSIAEKQLEKMNWLIQNLLKLSRLDAGTIRLKEESVPVRELVEDTLSPFLIQLDVKEISVKKCLGENVLMIDKNWTAESLRNIVKNCIEHMEQGGTLSIENEENSLYHTIRIRDDGCGIAPEDLPHIFERFYKGKDTSGESVGIGLSLTKTILEKQRGTITAESTPGEGTTFEIRLYKSII